MGTPIGNLEDITLRAARVLGEVSLVAAEDTRVTRRLLSHLGLRVALISCNAHNWPGRIPELVGALEKGDAALVTDAGMPTVSDPGSGIVNAVAEAGHRVEVIPGPSAVTTALAASGISADAFLFVGFLPRRRRDRQRKLEEVSQIGETLVFFEAPHRLRTSLADLLFVLGNRRMAVCRELTKLHEEVRRGAVTEMLEHFTAPRGEFVLVVAGALGENQGNDSEAAADVALEQLVQLRRSGAKARDAVAEIVSSTGLSRKEVYRLWLESREVES